MRIVSWNVNGVRAILRKGFLDWVKEESPDVICLQETKLQEHQIPEELLNLRGYESYWAHAEKKGYSGVAIFCRDPKPEVTVGLDLPEFDAEGRTLLADFGDFVLINGYFPNGGRGPERVEYKLRYYEKLLGRMEEIRAAGSHIVVTGDFNTAHNEIDLARPEDNRKKSGFMDIEREWVFSSRDTRTHSESFIRRRKNIPGGIIEPGRGAGTSAGASITSWWIRSSCPGWSIPG